MLNSNNYTDFRPLFELGFTFNEDPGVRVISQCEICPTQLAALATVLFETVMRTVPDNKQIQFEQQFLKSLKILMDERCNYDTTIVYPDNNESE